MTINRGGLTATFLWSAILAVGWLAYAPGLSGAFLLDDFPNLLGLAQIKDQVSAIHFALSGSAGPIGRPLALATFLPQAADWGGVAKPFLRVNILIHLANACVLVWVLHQLTTAFCGGESRKPYIAITAAAIWLLMPLLASSSLMVIQRMTTLSAFFVLLGIAGYLHARQYISLKPKLALTGMSLALVTATMLAALAKENGALLPTFVLVIEMTLVNRPRNLDLSRWRAWKSIFLVFPTVVILGYLLWQLPYKPDITLTNGFNGWERLLTESRILWEYLFNAFIPQPAKFGPFHDGHAVARTIMDPVTLLALSGWATTLVLAVIWRRKHPLFAFASLWFLGGHLLESTTIPLDVYFEHRNYLPIVGPVYALCLLAADVPSHLKKLAAAGAAAYIVVNAFALFSLASLWGNPPEAFRYWHERFPNSMYAATEIIRYELAAKGPRHGVQVMSEFVAGKPEAGYLKIQELKLSCEINSHEDQGRTVAELTRLLKNVDFSYTPLTMLSQLTESINRTECNGVDNDTVRTLALALLDNPRYRIDIIYNQLHHKLMALIAQYEGSTDEAMNHLQQAAKYKRSNDLNKMIVVTYVHSNQFEAARLFIEEGRRNPPFHPMRRFVWLARLDSLDDYVDEAEQIGGLRNASPSSSASLP